jgi:ATP-binding cassette subfamily C (CFTR/MRP) protein 9
MAVIPQDPVLFAGTVRYNLDPAGRQPDEKLWEALRVAQLGDVVKCLDDEVLENGENFSMGQRQLFCLARAFLKQSRILCLDEATASVDQDTDKVIQGLIRTVFVGCTIVTIAHRISTIMDYDKVLVLAEGRVVEYDSPATLLQSESVFKSLVDASKKHEE